MQKAFRKLFSLAAVLCFTILYPGAFTPLDLPVHAAVPETTALTHITAAQLPDWLKGKHVAFVEFYSPTCGFCLRAQPILEKLAVELSLPLAQIDVTQDENNDLVAQLGLDSIPTIVTYVDGKPLPNYQVGLYTEARYREFFQKAIATYHK